MKVLVYSVIFVVVITILCFVFDSHETRMIEFGKKQNMEMVESDMRIIVPCGPYYVGGKGASIYKTTYRTDEGKIRIFWFRFWFDQDIYEEINGQYVEIE